MIVGCGSFYTRHPDLGLVYCRRCSSLGEFFAFFGNHVRMRLVCYCYLRGRGFSDLRDSFSRRLCIGIDDLILIGGRSISWEDNPRL